MHIDVNGTRLFVDVEGPGLVPDGATMREKPTLVLLHGGPAADHSYFKPAFSALSDVAQIVYVDHRGCGRSADSDPATWHLDQWGDDVKALCDALGVSKPIVFGESFGGYVAQAYATRHPEHPSKLILASTAASMDFEAVFDAFARIGGAEVARIARERWTRPTPASRATYMVHCVPLYRPPMPGSAPIRRTIAREAVALHFTGEGREVMRMDFRPVLGSVRCPVLVMVGDADPITPVAFSEAIVASLPPALVRFKRFQGCGHGVQVNDPERFFATMRDFINEVPQEGVA